MNLKKVIPFSDHFPFFTFPKKKLFSGFSLGLVSFFIFLCLVFFNVSFKNPISSNTFVFRGFSGVNDNSSSSGSGNKSALISWSLSFTRNPAVNSSDNGKLGDLGDAHFGNFTNDVKNGSFNGDFEGTLLSNVTNDAKNVSFDANSAKSDHSESTLLSNDTNDVKNSSFSGVYGKNSDFEGTLLSNGTNDVKNVSFDTNSAKSDNSESTLLSNGTKDMKNGSFDANFAKSDHSESTLLSNGTNDVKNVTFDAKSEHSENTLLSNVTSDVKNSSFDAIGDDSIGGKDANASLVLGNLSSSYKECDIFDGRWVRDDTKPYYPAGSCPYIDRDFDCHLNKRPDDGYVKWKWQPFGCDIPSLNATDFLERLRGKKLVFIGDSLNRNMWESLVCILRASVPDKKRVCEISGRHEFKKKGFYAFRFEDYDCTVDFVSSPFLVRETSFKGKNGSVDTLRLDLMDRTTSMYHDADVLVFNTGHWWTHEKTSLGENYYQEGNHVYPRLKVLDAYKRALSTWARWVDTNIDINKTQVIFRGYSVTHFKGGQWNSGGKCHKETEPIFNTSHFKKYPSKMRAFDNVLREMKTPVVYLNISRLTDYRKDGHPSIYRREYKTVEEQIAAVRSQDCSHWCLPGVPDTWNELLYASLLKVGRGSWKI